MSKTTVRKSLEQFDAAELRQLIFDLYAKSKEAKEILDFYAVPDIAKKTRGIQKADCQGGVALLSPRLPSAHAAHSLRHQKVYCARPRRRGRRTTDGVHNLGILPNGCRRDSQGHY